MTIFYSADTRGFYDTDIHGDGIPGDAVEVTAEDYAAVFSAQCKGASIQPDEHGYPIAVYPAVPSLIQVKAGLCASVDAQADVAYIAIGGPSPGRLAEYQQADIDARAFKAAGYTGEVPETVQCQCIASGMTPEQAADDIIATAANWNAALVAIRSARLIGKGKVNAAETEDLANAEAKSAIDAINAVAAAAS
jgi:hypothetical protein